LPVKESDVLKMLSFLIPARPHTIATSVITRDSNVQVSNTL
jgi:hypothetical protein